MKLAIISDDGETVSRHFGRAAHFLVVTIEAGKETNRELRDKLGHNQFSEKGGGEPHGDHHGMEAGSHLKHTQMAGNIADCEVLVCGGMGRGAYQSISSLNIKPVVTDLEDVKEVIEAYLEGTLTDHTELLH
jgi:predicted Fe-Mo cluster-binding NifX family protein